MIAGPLVIRDLKNSLEHHRRIKKNANTASVKMIYSEEFLFYKALQRHLENGLTVVIRFPNEKLSEKSKLVKRIAFCQNEADLGTMLSHLIDEVKGIFDINFITSLAKGENLTPMQIVSILIKFIKSTTDSDFHKLFRAYRVQYEFEDDSQRYAIALNPRILSEKEFEELEINTKKQISSMLLLA